MLVDLAFTPISEVIRQISAERRSGDLSIRYDHETKTVIFDRGRLVFAASSLKEDRLGESLVAMGRISDDDFRRASLLMRRDHSRRFGEALVEMGLMDKDELGGSVAKQVRRIVLSLFKLKGGVAVFDARSPSVPVEYMVSLSVHRLLYVGIRSMSADNLVLVGLGDLERKVALAPVPPFRFVLHKCPAGELKILEAARREITLRELASTGMGVSPARARVVYALFASGVLQDADTLRNAKEMQPVVQMEPEGFLLSPMQRQSEKPRLEVIRQEVEQELANLEKIDREGWLRLSSPEKMKAAIDEKMERYFGVLEAVEQDRELRQKVEVVLGRAAALLHWLKKRSDSLPAGSRGTHRGATEAALRKLLVARAGTPPAEAKPAPAAKAGGARKGEPAAKGEAAPKEGAAQKTGAAPKDEAAPKREAAQETEAAPQSEAVAKEAAPEGEAAPPAAAGEPSPSTGETPVPAVSISSPTPGPLEQLQLDGDVRMKIQDFAGASQIFGRLVEKAPRVAAYRVRLAIAMTCWPPTARQAEREFLQATRLEPDNAWIHFQFGLYYKRMGLRNRALAELRAAVSLDPKDAEARRDLEAISPHDAALTTLKKRLLK
jgi:tetratricopeptide (TPR) repeat protein